MMREQQSVSDLGKVALNQSDNIIEKLDFNKIEKLDHNKIKKLADIFFVGDSAGREGDYSDFDLKFAQNCGISFFTPEEYFKL